MSVLLVAKGLRNVTHYAVQLRQGGYLAGTTEHGQIISTPSPGCFQVMQTRGQAEHIARIVGGRVVPVVCTPQSASAGEWFEKELFDLGPLPEGET